jgi:UDP-N-acetylglucosamine--N-acetylmuramyl-(pentapeptide) pyrophosphoryl-undecaprenol N-acetylglucosamine transferase
VNVLLSGGGTAGHIYPALSVAQRLLAGGHEVAFAGTPDGLEARLVPEAGIAFFAVPSRGFDRGRPLTIFSSGFVAARALGVALSVLRRFSPDVVVGFGAYVSLPVGLAAVARGVPLVVHEQNAVPGLANRVLSRWAAAACVTYEGSVHRLRHPERARVTGNPVRPEILAADRLRGRRDLGVPDDALVLLVFGGSRGARHLNETFVDLAEELMEVPRLWVVHSTGRAEHESVAAAIRRRLGGEQPRYRMVDYIDRMGDALAAADMVVARAGATSIAEITAVGRPAILVPYPYATGDHQTLNARALAQAGAAEVVADADLGEPAFRDAVMRLVHDAERRERMARVAAGLARPDAASRVAQVALAAAEDRKGTR